MFLFAVFCVIVAILIAIAILTVQYFKTYAKLKSHTAYDAAAKKKMRDLKAKDSNITCDYCGTKFDTKVYDTCPHCGAAYNKDEEWTSRFTYDQDQVDAAADDFADDAIQKAKQDAAEVAKKIRKCILILAGIFAFLLVVAIIGYIGSRIDMYARDEKLNKYDSDRYALVTDAFSNDGVIYDQDGVTIRISGIYKQDNAMKVEYHLINTCSKPRQIRLECDAINGYAKEYMYVYELVKAKDDVTLYETIYNPGFDTVASMIFTDLRVESKDYKYVNEITDLITLTVEGATETAPVVNGDKVIFENDYIRIYEVTDDLDDDHYTVSIENCSDYCFNLDEVEAMVAANSGTNHAGKEVSVSGAYNELIPAHCIYNNLAMRCYTDTAEEEFLQYPMVSYAFTCIDQPEATFSTGYIGTEE